MSTFEHGINMIEIDRKMIKQKTLSEDMSPNM